MTRQQVMQQLKNLRAFYLVYIWNDCATYYNLKHIRNLYDEMYTTQEVQKMVDFEKLADYVLEVKYWKTTPEIIKGE